jgi:dUTP pyrophosphatase
MSVDLTVKFKKLSENAGVPTYQHEGDAGADLTAVSVSKMKSVSWIDEIFPVYEYGTGLAMEIPDTHYAMLTPRSSISKHFAWLTNSVGIIDSQYRGEIKFRFRTSFLGAPYQVGDRIGQIVFARKRIANFTETNELSSTERGEGGFGSTGL